MKEVYKLISNKERSRSESHNFLFILCVSTKSHEQLITKCNLSKAHELLLNAGHKS